MRLPILRQASRALTRLFQAKADGRFTTSPIGRALKRGCKAAGVAPFRVYDLRHRFLTTAATVIKDDRVVAALALHAPARDEIVTWRYTEQSVSPRLVAGMRRLQKHFGTRG